MPPPSACKVTKMQNKATPIDTNMTDRGSARDRWTTLAWWLLSAAVVELVPAFLKFHLPAWALGIRNEGQVLAAGMALLSAALAYEAVGKSGSRRWRCAMGALFVCIAFGCAAFLVALAGAPLSRLTFGISFGLAMLLMLLRIVQTRGRLITTGALAILVLVTAGASVREESETKVEVEQTTLPTTFYRLAIETYPVTYGTELGKAQGGALTSLGDLHVLSTMQGHVYTIRQQSDGKLLIRPSDIRVPLRLDEFLQFSKYPEYPVRVTGLAASPSGAGATLYAAYDHWNREKDCLTTRVARLALTLSGEAGLTAVGDWLPVYESKPCLERTTGYDPVQTGGKLVIRADGRLLLSLGDRGINGLNGLRLADRDDNDYGKVIQFDADGSNASVFTKGHRNPQGLTLGRSGSVWETEHGPQGGDEVNLLVAGNNYGWPTVSYGTDYGHFVWPLSPEAHDHGPFTEPVFAFVPSIGISDLIESHSAQFPEWDGDLIVSSLKAVALYRIRLRDSRAIYSEPIEIGHRVRDLTSTASGDLVLWTDDGYIVRISPATQSTAYDQCSGCHEPRGQMPALGPPLRSVVGRKVADHFEFGYSPALQKLGGNWTAERLDDFLKDPGAYAPGTTMTFRGIPDAEERARVVEFLKEYE